MESPPEMSDDDMIYALEQVAVLHATRADSDGNLNALMHKLAAITADMPWKAACNKDAGKAPPGQASIRKLKLSDIAHGFIANWREASRIGRALRMNGPIEIYGIDTVRLDWVPGRSLRETVRRHTAAGNPVIAEWFAATEPLPERQIILDPYLRLARPTSTGKTSAPAMTPMSMIMLGLRNPLRFPYRSAFPFWQRGWSLLKETYPPRLKRLSALLSLHLYLSGARQVARHSGSPVRLMTMTSNSIFLEAFRALALAQSRSWCVEVQHGLSSPRFDPYFMSYRSRIAERDDSRFDILPLAARPYCSDALISGGFRRWDIASNTGIFSSLNRICPRWNDPELSEADSKKALEDSLFNVASAFCDSRKPVFAIFGGAGLVGDFYQSEFFATEMRLLGALVTKLNGKGLNVELVYLPHPRVYTPHHENIRTIENQDIGGRHMKVLRSSHLAFFFADYAFSMYSASTFEAAWMGARTFSPMVRDDGMFWPGMFKQIHHPETLTRKDLEAAMDRFCQPVETTELREKISGRLNRLISGK